MFNFMGKLRRHSSLKSWTFTSAHHFSSAILLKNVKDYLKSPHFTLLFGVHLEPMHTPHRNHLSSLIHVMASHIWLFIWKKEAGIQTWSQSLLNCDWYLAPKPSFREIGTDVVLTYDLRLKQQIYETSIIFLQNCLFSSVTFRLYNLKLLCLLWMMLAQSQLQVSEEAQPSYCLYFSPSSQGLQEV